MSEPNAEWMVTCRCGVQFDLRTAPWCHHKPIPTKLCPRGHCVCHKLKDEGIWREATPAERLAGFAFMLKEQYGGKREEVPASDEDLCRGVRLTCFGDHPFFEDGTWMACGDCDEVEEAECKRETQKQIPNAPREESLP